MMLSFSSALSHLHQPSHCWSQLRVCHSSPASVANNNFAPSRRTWRPVPPQMTAATDMPSPPDDNKDGDGMDVYKSSSGRKLPNQGDDLPFDVKVVSPPPHSLGKFMLNPRTGRGDIVEHKEQSYVVKRVISHYRVHISGPEMFKKTIEVKSLARKSIENYLEKKFRES